MEGRGNFGYNHANFILPPNLNSPLLFRPTPPFSAIDRFLLGNGSKNTTHFYHQNQSKTTSKTMATTPNVFYDFSTSSSNDFNFNFNVNGSGIFQWPNSMHDMNFVDEWIIDGEESPNSEISCENEVSKNEENFSISNSKKSKGRKGKGSIALIKGQWTEEEDRMLINLVKKYGVRKWALIAQNLVGRAGKQCRERWHNHLRPDIKKDSWSEEEEMLLVEAHEQFGNRWAEIARRIPGRTENSIKNHWNATKRRQNSRRRNKKNESEGKITQTSILQEYIKNKTLCKTTENPNPTTPNTASPSSVSATTTTTLSGDPLNQSDNLEILLESSDEYYESSPLTISDPNCHDELVFIQNLFNTNLSRPNYDDHEKEIIDSLAFEPLDDHHDQNQPLMPPFDHFMMNPNNNNTNNTHFYSDLYVSYLLGGAHQPSSNELIINHHHHDDDDIKKMDMMVIDHAHDRKDMDLIEMVSSSKFSQVGSN